MAMSMQMKPAKQQGGEEEIVKGIMEQKIKPGDLVFLKYSTESISEIPETQRKSGLLAIFSKLRGYEGAPGEFGIHLEGGMLLIPGPFAGIVKLEPGDFVKVKYDDGSQKELRGQFLSDGVSIPEGQWSGVPPLRFQDLMQYGTSADAVVFVYANKKTTCIKVAHVLDIEKQ